jgi:hypothetical protein
MPFDISLSRLAEAEITPKDIEAKREIERYARIHGPAADGREAGGRHDQAHQPPKPHGFRQTHGAAERMAMGYAR